MRAAVPALCALALALAGCGGGEDRPPESDPFTEVRREAERPAAVRAAPRWERLTVLTGTGQATPSVTVADDAIQWRARWRCTQGELAVSYARGESLVRGRCPGKGRSTSAVATGPQRLAVRTDGRWRLEIEQQVDAPLREPPLRALSAPSTRVLARGRFYGIERRGAGTATLHRLRGGRLALRFEDFETAPNTDLFVWVSRAAGPRTTRAAFRSPHISAAALKATLGDQNYVLPRSIRERDVRSIVIWCEPVRIAYAAASLERP